MTTPTADAILTTPHPQPRLTPGTPTGRERDRASAGPSFASRAGWPVDLTPEPLYLYSMSDDTPKIGSLAKLICDYADAVWSDMADRPMYFQVYASILPGGSLHGPPAPRVNTYAFDLYLYDGCIFGSGNGWEGGTGSVTREEAQKIIGLLQWALDNDLLDDDDND